MMDTFSMVFSFMTDPFCSDAAAGLGDSGDPRGGLRRSLGEELVELLDVHAGAAAEDPHRGAGPLRRVLGAHEADDLPVPVGQLADPGLARDLLGQVLGPRVGIEQEALVVHGHLVAGVGRGRHVRVSSRVGSLIRLPCTGMAAVMPGIWRPGSSSCQYRWRNISFPRWLSRDWASSGRPSDPG